jgi:antitoxin HicB
MQFIAQITEDHDGWNVEFPDKPNVFTCGDNLEEALAMAEEALNSIVEYEVEIGLALAEPVFQKANSSHYSIEIRPHILVAYQISQARKGQTQTEIAQKIGITQQSYQRLENPKKSNPSIKTLEKVAKALGKRLEIQFV